MSNTIRQITLCAGLLLLNSCSNPFAPSKVTPDGIDDEVPVQPATTIEIYLDNIEKAMDERDKDLYESLLDQRFWFSENDCLGQSVFANDLETELEILTGSRDGSREGIWDIFRDFNFDYSLIERTVELGPEYPNAFEGDPNGHPDENWEVLRLQVNMLMTDGQDNGFRVNQIMFFKLRRDEEGLFKMARWDNDALAGECSDPSAKTAVMPWGTLKQNLSR